MEEPSSQREEQSSHYKELFDLTSDALFLIDRDTGVLLDANRSAVQMYGFDRQELLGGMRNTDLSAQPEQTRQALRSEQPHVLVRWHRKKDGVVFPVEITASYLRREGRVLQLAAIRDISARLESERALRESEARFSAFMDRLPSMVLIKDSRFRPIYANRAMRAAFPVDSWLGKTPAECFPERIAADMVARDQEAMDSGFIAYSEEWRDKDGVQRYLRTQKFRIELPASEPLLGVMIHDVSEDRATQEALVNARRIESLGALAGGIAHEFNNLLTGLFGSLSLARQEENCPPAVAEYLDLAMGAYERAQGLSSRLLTFASGGEPVKTSTALAPIVEEVARFEASGSQVRLEFDFPGDLWKVEVDTRQLPSALAHLVRNAREAMPDGGTLRIRGRNLPAASPRSRGLAQGDFVELEMTDEGSGISAEHLHRIFDPFFSTKGQGRGLGLAIAYSILVRHGGLMAVASSPGKGATFTLYLPVSVSPGSVRVSMPPQGHERSSISEYRVLVLDDEPVVRSLLSATLTRLGCDVQCVASGQEVVEEYRRGRESGRPYCWALLDVIVPGGMGALEVRHVLSAEQPDFLMVVTSGYSEDPVMARPGEFGFVDSLSKPFRFDDVERLVTRMRARRARTEGEHHS